MATVAKMVVNNGNGQRGLVCQYDVVCFDEVAGVSFDQKDGVNILKGYMASGEFSRGKETKISMEFYKDPDDAVFKGLEE
jgi:ATP-dependent Lon protease